MANVLGLDHIQLAMPEGGETSARAFYGGILGLTEIFKPANLAKRGGVWFACGALQLHLGVEHAFQPAKKAHPTLLVQDLKYFTSILEAQGFEIRSDDPLDGYERAFTSDPFGNRIELMERIAAATPSTTG